jgi:hypothetical protein
MLLLQQLTVKMPSSCAAEMLRGLSSMKIVLLALAPMRSITNWYTCDDK